MTNDRGMSFFLSAERRLSRCSLRDGGGVTVFRMTRSESFVDLEQVAVKGQRNVLVCVSFSP